MTRDEAIELKKEIINTLIPEKIVDGKIIMATTFKGAHGLYVLDGIVRQVIYSNETEYDIAPYIGELLVRDYFAAKASLVAVQER